MRKIRKNMRKAVFMAAFLLMTAASAFAVHGAERVEVEDSAGHTVFIEKNGDIKMTGDCIFRIKDISRGRLLVCEKDKNGMEKFSELRGGRHLVRYGEDKMLSFLLLDENTMNYRPVNGLPENIHVIPVAVEKTRPDADFSYDQKSEYRDSIVLSGKAPSLKVSASEGMVTYVQIEGNEEAKRYRVTDSDLIYNFKEGAYKVSVWNEDGYGHIFKASVPFESFIYKTAFDIGEENSSEDEDEEEEDEEDDEDDEEENEDREKPEIRRLTAEIIDNRLLIKAGCRDKGSGIDKSRLFMDGSETALKEGKEECEYELPLESIKKGSHDVLLNVVDKAGNKAEKEFRFEIEDDKAPELYISGFENMGIYGREVRIELTASDDELTFAEADIEKINKKGEVIESRKIPLGNYTLKEEGRYRVVLKAEDKSGNKSAISRCLMIDKTAPRIIDISKINKKYIRELSLNNSFYNAASDECLSGVAIYLNGREYTGEKISSPGHYVMEVKARDKAGNTADSTAEFVIRGRR